MNNTSVPGLKRQIVSKSEHPLAITNTLISIVMLMLFLTLAPQTLANNKSAAKETIPITVTVFEDTLGEVDSNEVLSTPEKFDFKNLHGQINFGISHTVFWFKIDVPGQNHSKTALLEISYPQIDQLDIFIPDTGNWKTINSGDLLPFSDRVVTHSKFLIPIQLTQSNPARLFLRVQSDGPITVPIQLWETDSFHVYDQRRTLFYGLYFGFMLALIIYILFLYISIRDRSYLYYIGYLGFITLFLFAMAGLLAQYVFPNSPKVINYAAFMFLYLAMAIGFKFVGNVNNTSDISPNLNKLLNIATVLYLGILILGLILGTRFLSLVSPYFVFIWVVLYVFAIVLGIYSKYKPSYYVGLAFLAIIPGAILYPLAFMGIVSKSAWSDHALQAGVAIEALLLSFALAYRIRYIQEELEIISTKADLQRKVFAMKLIEARDRERQEIATELHDGLGQNLLIIKNRLDDSLTPDHDNNPNLGVSELIENSITDVRNLSHHLHPHILDRLGLKQATIEVIEESFREQEVQVEYLINEIKLPKKSIHALHLYRIIQEATKNILLHASASRVEIYLNQTPKAISLVVEDFPSKATQPWIDSIDHSQSFGLSNIIERVSLLNGEVEFVHNNTGGLRIEIKIPFLQTAGNYQA